MIGILYAIQRNDAEIGFYLRVLPPALENEPQMAMAGAMDNGAENQPIPAAGAPAGGGGDGETWVWTDDGNMFKNYVPRGIPQGQISKLLNLLPQFDPNAAVPEVPLNFTAPVFDSPAGLKGTLKPDATFGALGVKMSYVYTLSDNESYEANLSAYVKAGWQPNARVTLGDMTYEVTNQCGVEVGTKFDLTSFQAGGAMVYFSINGVAQHVTPSKTGFEAAFSIIISR